MESDLVRKASYLAVAGALGYGLYYLVAKEDFQSISTHPQVYAPMNQMSTQSQLADNPAHLIEAGESAPRPDQLNIVKQNTNVLPYPQYSNNYGPMPSQNKQFAPPATEPPVDHYPKDTVTPQELLPREDPYNTWSQVNPTTQGHLADKNFLESGHHFGINTVGSSLRNANTQLRSDPLIPQIPVGPWYQTTIEADTNRRAFDIGGDY